MLKKILLGLAMITTLGSATPVIAHAAPVVPQPQRFFAAECPGRFLTLPAWYRGLQGDTACNPKITKLTDVWIIALNVVEMLLHIATYVAAGFVMWGGFKYIMGNSGGSPDAAAGAKSTIQYALTGLAITVMAIAAVNFIVDAAL